MTAAVTADGDMAASAFEVRCQEAWTERRLTGDLPDGVHADELPKRPCEPDTNPRLFAEHLRDLSGHLRRAGLSMLADQAVFVAHQLVGGEPEGQRGRIVEESPGLMVRELPALTEDDINRTVLHARAVVELDRRVDEARATAAQLEARVAQQRESAKAAEQERRNLLDRLLAVTGLHSEAFEPACADGCCTNGLGKCEYCGEPYPCRTRRAADGEAAES